MTLETLTTFLGWSTLINTGFLLLAGCVQVFIQPLGIDQGCVHSLLTDRI